MYHILPLESQAQFRGGEATNDEGNMTLGRCRSLQFSPTIGRGFGRFHDKWGRILATQGFLNLIEAQVQFATANNNAINSLYDLHLAESQLSRATGELRGPG